MVQEEEKEAEDGEREEEEVTSMLSSYDTLYPVQSPRVPPIEVELKVNNAPMKMEVDTGASVTVVSEKAFNETWKQGRPQLNLHDNPKTRLNCCPRTRKLA